MTHTYRFVQAPNATMNDAWCEANAVKPTALLPPHTAPLDIKFAPRLSDGNLYATLHGSWNRSPPQVRFSLTSSRPPMGLTIRAEGLQSYRRTWKVLWHRRVEPVREPRIDQDKLHRSSKQQRRDSVPDRYTTPNTSLPRWVLTIAFYRMFQTRRTRFRSQR